MSVDGSELVNEVYTAILAETSEHADRLYLLGHLAREGILTFRQACELHAQLDADSNEDHGPNALVWKSPRMRAALAHRDLQKVFTIMRGHGWTQRSIGAKIGSTQSEISEILTGRRHGVHYNLFAKVALGFGLPRAWLGLAYDIPTGRLLAANGQIATQ